MLHRSNAILIAAVIRFRAAWPQNLAAATGLILAAIVMGISCQPCPAQEANPFEDADPNDPENPFNVPIPEGAFHVRCALFMDTVSDQICYQFNKRHNAYYMSTLCIDSDVCLQNLFDGKCAVAVLNDMIIPFDEKTMGHLHRYPYAYVCAAVFVNKKNPLRKLTIEQLADIYSGAVTQWDDLKGPKFSGAIHLYIDYTRGNDILRYTTSLRGRGFARQIFAHETQAEHRCRNTSVLMGKVALHPRSIGVALYDPNMLLDKRVKVLKVAEGGKAESALPVAKSIADGTYPLVAPLTLYARPDASPWALKFCEFAVSKEAAKFTHQDGILHQTDIAPHQARARQALVKTGKAPEIVVHGPANMQTLMQELIRHHINEHAAVRLKYRPGPPLNEKPTEDAGAEFLRGNAELLVLDAPLDEAIQEKIAHNWPGQSPPAITLGRTAIGVIVHPKNTIKRLLLSDVQDIYEGRVRNWSNRRPKIRIYGPASKSDLVQLFQTQLGITTKPVGYTARGDTRQVVRSVAHDPDSLGIIDLGKLPPDDVSVKLVRLIAPARKEPRQEHSGQSEPEDDWLPGARLKDSAQTDVRQNDAAQNDVTAPVAHLIPADYPLAKTYTLYVSPEASQTAKDFAKYLTPSRIHQSLAPHGILPPGEYDLRNREDKRKKK